MKRLLPLILLITTLLSGISIAQGRTLNEIRRSGVVRVAFTQSGMQTVNYFFAKEFAQFLNCELEIVPITWNEIFSQNGKVPADYITNDSVYYTPDALRKADFICGTTYMYPWREKFFDFAGIMQVSDLLIISKVRQRHSAINNLFVPEILRPKGHKLNVKNYKDLKGLRIALMENSSYENNIDTINQLIGGGIEIVKTHSEEESQELARTGEVDGFATVSYVGLQFVKENSQNFKLAFPIGKPDNVAWAVEKGNNSLKMEIDNFFHTIKGTGKLDMLFSEKFGFNYASYNKIIDSYSKTSVTNEGHFRDMDEIMESGKLIVALRDRDLVYHKSGQKQLNHYLAGELAKYLGLDLEIQIVPSLSSYFYDSHGNIVKDSAYTPERFNHIDIACDLLSPVDWRLNKIDILDVMPTADVVIARKDVDIKSINDLSKYRGVTSKGSIYEEDLIDNNLTNYYYKEANEFFSEIMKGRADYTITNFDIYSLPQYPELEAKFVISDIYTVGWGIMKNQPKLRQKILEFMEWSKTSETLNDAFKEQAGIPYNAAQNHLNALYQTYQTGYFPFVFYGSDQGLPQEDVRCIFQDHEGYIWIGTQSGAIKFNGRSMEQISDLQGLANNIVFDIAQDSKGRIYFATLNGVSILDDGKFVNFFNNVPIKHIYIDNKDNVYLYGDKGLYFLSENHKQQTYMNSKVDQMPTIINSLSQLKSGRYTYLASPEGFYTLDRDGHKLTKLSNKNCTSVFVDYDSKIWLSTTDGIYTGNHSQFTRGNIDSLCINKDVSISNSRIHTIKQNRDMSIMLISDFEAYQIFSTKQSAIKYDQSIGLKNQKLLSFFEDKENNFWFGFSGGIQKLTNRSLRNLYPEIIDSYLNNIEEDAAGRIWMAFNNKIYYYQHKLVDFTQNLDGTKVPYVVTSMPNGDIFIADSYGWYIYDSKNLSRKNEMKFSDKIYNLKSAFASPTGDIFLLTGAEGVVFRIAGFDCQPLYIVNEHTSFVSQLENFNDMIVGGNNTGLIKFNGTTFEELCTTPSAVLGLRNIEGKLWVGMEDGLGIYTADGKFHKLNIPNMPSVSVNSIQQSRDKEHLWLGTNMGFYYYDIIDNSVEFNVYSNDGLPGNEIVTNGLLLNNKGVLYIATYHGVSVYDIRKDKSEKFVPDCRIENLYLNGSKISQQRHEFKASENNFTFELAGLSFKDEEAITYEFFMKGLDNDYVASSGKKHEATYQNMPAGNYEFVYRAKSKDGIWSQSQSYKFVIRKPFYATWWFITLMVLGTIGFIITLFKIREARLRQRNEQLERMVQERTSEIQKQKEDIELKNEELEAQREEIMVQRNIATKQRDEIAQREKEIMDSIYYAKRIQTAIMPTANSINNVLPENFILFRPRDIVSGDFYYFKHMDRYAVIVAADCTGHGVPGAFMSMLGSAYINEIVVNNQKELNSGRILDQLRELIIESLKQTGRVDEAKDGMDMALCVLDTQTRQMQFSGAFNPMLVVRNGEITEYRADRMPIGIHDNVNVNFTTYDVQMEKDDIVYIFSDGYASQFGGKHGRKIMTSRFHKILLEISNLPLSEQGTVLNDKIEKWMGVDYDQVDDILVMGFKIQ